MIHYLDTSALVKRYVQEPGTAAVRALFRRGVHLATARTAHPELVATLARLCRAGDLSPKTRDGIFARVESDLSAMTIVEIRPALLRRIPPLVLRRPLRGFDAIHLAAALALRDQGVAVDFWVADTKLADAAREEGLRAIEPG